jgi:hypothetical protein
MGRGVVWCGCGGGLRRLLNRFFLRTRSNLVVKKSRQGSRGDHAWNSYPLSFLAEAIWSLKWGKFTPKWPNSSPPQKGSLGALIHPKMVLLIYYSPSRTYSPHVAVMSHAPCMYCHCIQYYGPGGPSGPQHARRSERSAAAR